MYSVKFPNRVLPKQWYKDHTRVHIIFFTNCDISYIESDAFDTDSLKDLKTLHLISMTLEMRAGALNGLTAGIIGFTGMTIQNMNYKFMEIIAETVEMISLKRLDIETHLYNIIGGVKLKRLRSLTFTMVPLLRIITPNTVTKTPVIQEIIVHGCGLEVILDHSFDHLPATLELVSLRYNKLKTLPARLFDKLDLEFSREFIEDNPLECDCNLIELANVHEDIFGFYCEHEIDVLKIDHSNCSSEPPKSREVKLYESRQCFRHYGTNTLRVAYTDQYRLKVILNESAWLIKSIKRSRFHFFILTSHGDGYTNAGAICYTLYAKYGAISMDKLRVSEGAYVACVIPSSTERRVWPLNCFSIILDRPNMWIGEDIRIPVIFLGITLNLISFVVAIYLGVYLVKNNLVFLNGADRVIIGRNKTNHKIDTVLVMPTTWKESRLQSHDVVSLNDDHLVDQNNRELFKPKTKPILSIIPFASQRRALESDYYVDCPCSPRYESIASRMGSRRNFY